MYRIRQVEKCLLLGASILFCSCSGLKETSPAIAGSDRDKHGCIPSAGYVWSELKQDCIRAFELAIQLREIEGVESTYIRQIGVLLSLDNKSCELFLGDKPIILTLLDKDYFIANRKDEKYILRKVDNKWQLEINDTTRFLELAK